MIDESLEKKLIKLKFPKRDARDAVLVRRLQTSKDTAELTDRLINLQKLARLVDVLQVSTIGENLVRQDSKFAALPALLNFPGAYGFGDSFRLIWGQCRCRAARRDCSVTVER